MEKRTSESGRGHGSFLVEILQTQHQTWQGKVTWLDENRQKPFRSAMELLKLIDSVVDTDDGTDGGETE